MKAILIILLSFAAMTSMAQNTDENGRPVGAKPAQVVNASSGPGLVKGNTSTSSDLKLNYTLPSGETSGSIKLFDGRRDLEVKEFELSTTTGTQSINLKEYEGKAVVAALYDSKGKFITEYRLY